MRRAFRFGAVVTTPIQLVGIGLALAMGAATAKPAADGGSAAASDKTELSIGTAVVPVDQHVLIHRVMVLNPPEAIPEEMEPAFMFTRANVRRLQLRAVNATDETQKLDVDADEIFLFHISRVRPTDIEVTSQDKKIRGWLRPDQVISVKEALARVNRAIEQTPGDTKALIRRARLHGTEQKWEAAFADLEAALRRDPASAAAFKARSELYIAIGDLDAALDDFDRYANMQSTNATFFISRARRWLEQDEGRAAVDLEHAQTINPDHPGIPLGWYRYWRLKAQPDRALAELDEAIRRDPAALSAYELRADEMADLGEMDKAIADWNQAIKLQPNDPVLFRARAEIWMALEEPEKAIADYSRAIELDPDTVKSYVRRADASSANNRHNQAIADYSAAIKLDPKCGEAFLGRGKAWQAKGDADRAISDLTEAIRLEPMPVETPAPFGAPTDSRSLALRFRGDLLLQKKEPARAIADYDRLIEAEPGDCEALYRRGCAKFDLMQLDQAIVDLDSAIAQEPTRDDIYYTRGRLWFDKKNYGKAIADFTEAIVLDPEDANSSWRYAGRARCHFAKREFDRAIADYTHAIKLEPQVANYHNERGRAWSEKKDYSHAIADLSVAVQLAPKNAVFRTARGIAFRRNKDLARALDDLDEAIRLEPQNPIHHVERSNVWLDKKEFKRAVEELTAAIKLAPNSTWIYGARGIALRRNKEHSRALEDFGRALRLDTTFPGWWHSHIAWIRATCPDPALRDGKSAVSLATRGCQLVEWKNPFALQCLAAACAEAGDFESAVKFQKKTIALWPADDSTRTKHLDRLAQFEKKQPYREQADD